VLAAARARACDDARECWRRRARLLLTACASGRGPDTARECGESRLLRQMCASTAWPSAPTKCTSARSLVVVRECSDAAGTQVSARRVRPPDVASAESQPCMNTKFDRVPTVCECSDDSSC
jgi:hypothetical protein